MAQRDLLELFDEVDLSDDDEVQFNNLPHRVGGERTPQRDLNNLARPVTLKSLRSSCM